MADVAEAFEYNPTLCARGGGASGAGTAPRAEDLEKDAVYARALQDTFDDEHYLYKQKQESQIAVDSWARGNGEKCRWWSSPRSRAAPARSVSWSAFRVATYSTTSHTRCRGGLKCNCDHLS